MNNDTNYFYAIFYSLWRIRFLLRLKTTDFFRKVFGAILPQKWQTKQKANKTRTVRRSFVIADKYAQRFMMFMILLNLSFFVSLISGYLVTKGFNFKSSLKTLFIISVLFLLYLGYTLFQEERYSKYLEEYDKRDTEWKTKWCIISIVYVILSIGCFFLGAVLSVRISS